jgi:hypothetical protein
MRSLSVSTVSNYFKKAIAILAMAMLIQSCATVNGVPSGVLYSNIKGPLLITDGNQSNQVGHNSVALSKSHSIFYLINWGDASVAKALGSDLVAPGMQISHVDFKFWHLLGCGTYTTIVYYNKPTIHGTPTP